MSAHDASAPAPAPATAPIAAGVMVRPSAVQILQAAAFDALLAQEWARAKRDRVALALLQVQIDQIADFMALHKPMQVMAALAALEGVLRAAVFRPGDALAHQGPGAYAVLLPGVRATGAQVVAKRLREQTHAKGLPYAAGKGGLLTLSIGVAALYPQGSDEPQHLLQLASAALRQAQQSGGDQIAL